MRLSTRPDSFCARAFATPQSLSCHYTVQSPLAHSAHCVVVCHSGAGKMWRIMAQARNLPLIVPVLVFHTDDNTIN